ncbi:hypothetical protein EsDP_00004622 [Epichloe bromicola]|uniref:CoxI translation protein CYA5 n=1 Tax=Epichloe bromicola TaxID=79588 RepID=A0ABQ0CS96_9HYPO
MLERTAATLSKPGRLSKRCRYLSTDFWQHGASAIELSSIWPSLNLNRRKESEQDFLEQADPPPQAGLLASAFLLDFLYPSGTYALLRRLYPALPRPQSGRKSAGAARPMNFTSHTVATEADASVALFRYGENGGRRSNRVRQYASRSDGKATRDHVPLVVNTESTTADFDPSDSTANGHSRTNRKAHSHSLTDLLTRPEDALYSDVWDSYGKLDQQLKQPFRSAVVVYLSTSRSMVDIGRAISILRQIPVQSWDDDAQAAGILVHLRAGDSAAALDVFNTGLHSRHSGAGLEHLLEDALMKREWTIILKVWLEHFSTLGKATSSFSEHHGWRIPTMTTIPDLATLYFAFERYLEIEAAESVRAMKLYEDTKLGLEALRRWLAQQVLRQPCSPKQAKSILQIWNDPTLYEQYLSRMLCRWEEGFETRAGLGLLSEIYSNYCKLDGVKTPVPILRKMFDFYYPSNAEGLAEVYRDWHHSWGGLDRWGHEKFLKFYSARGDIIAVKDLWIRYTTKFPKVVKRPLGFRSTLNAFAQAGDVAGAENEFRIMTEEYGVKPDIDSWNALLKCYTKADAQARAFQCFEEIKKVDRPDASTYAQVMAMAAKRGDLTAVLEFFDHSQKDKISISKEMALSLVMVYCHNDRLKDAEKICIEFAERHVTSAVVWNQLIYFNGQRGNLNKCFALLKRMKNYGVEWDHQTHEFLLRAMIHVGQIQPAYQLLRTAREDGLFPVGPEHYSVVASGAVRTGQLDLAETILSHMRSAGFEVPFKAHVSLVQAAVRRKPSAERTRALAKDLASHLLATLTSAKAQTAIPGVEPSPWTTSSGLVELRRQTADVGRTIMLLVELRDYVAVERLMSAYLRAFPEYKEGNFFPPEIASALMLGYLKDGKLDQVCKMWKQTLDGATANSSSASGAIYPAYQYDLARPLSVVIKACREANDGRGLLNTVEQVLGSGFKLTGTNWNLAIRHLADLGHWERAMDWCEQMLMTHWRGWTAWPAARTLQERRDLKNDRVLVASKATVFGLQREWLKLRKLAAWSGEVSSKLKDIEQRHPKLHHAFITTDYEHLPATWVLPRKKSMTKAIKEMLEPLSHDELKAMRKALEKQLRLEKDKKRHARKSNSSPFRVVAGRGKTQNQRPTQAPDQVVARAMTSSELNKLDAMPKEELAGEKEGTV